LININGEVIGVNCAIRAGAEGLGFAIPAGQVGRIYARLIRGEAAAQEALDLGLELAEAGRPRRGETGLLVLQAQPGGPAERGGLRKGDLLMSLDGSPTATMSDYELVVSSLAPGQSVKAEARRGENLVTLTLTPTALSQAEARGLAWKWYGLNAAESRGSLILEQPSADSPAAYLGLREGDILLRVGSRDLRTPADLARAMLENRFNTSIGLAVQRGRVIYQATLSR
ncbi:MAG: PDZ domain-containing protein, partial [Candidatus Adiutrix sp.]|nr:PDZ domain-containing protein [Candidatus Adiutrix sp.]